MEGYCTHVRLCLQVYGLEIRVNNCGRFIDLKSFLYKPIYAVIVFAVCSLITLSLCRTFGVIESKDFRTTVILISLRH